MRDANEYEAVEILSAAIVGVLNALGSKDAREIGSEVSSSRSASLLTPDPEAITTIDSAHREKMEGFHVFRYCMGDPAEGGRLYYIDGLGNDSLEAGITSALLQCGKSPVTALVQSEASDRPAYACWNEWGKKVTKLKTLHFCPQCPNPVACGHLDRKCRLSKSGNPKTAFKPKAIKAVSNMMGLEGPLNAEKRGQVWLNKVDTVYKLLIELQLRTIDIWCHWSQRKFCEAEAEFREQVEVRWFAAIFKGLNPKYATMDWNTDPNQLSRHIINAYFIGEGNCDSEEDAPPLKTAVESLLDCVSAGMRFKMRDIAHGEPGASFDGLKEEVAQNAGEHVHYLLGLPCQIEIGGDVRLRSGLEVVRSSRTWGDEGLSE